jgi:hypothetical protein
MCSVSSRVDKILDVSLAEKPLFAFLLRPVFLPLSRVVRFSYKVRLETFFQNP